MFYFILLLLLHGVAAYVGGATVSSTILIIARDQTSAENGAAAGLRGYGIPFDTLLVPQSGIPNIPILNHSATYGNYGGIVLMSEVGYDYDGIYDSALTEAQWEVLFAYQTQFGVRMVRLDVFPTLEFGVRSNGGNLNDEPVVLTNTSGFATANLRTNVGISIANIYHYPATIVNASTTWEVSKFNNSGTAAVINRVGARQQMVWFMPFALDWAASSNMLQHVWITWITRGLYVGFRRIYMSAQVDDMFLETNIYNTQGQIIKYRVTPDDMSMHATWQTQLNARLNIGSEFFLEIGHNGNGNIGNAVDTTTGVKICTPRPGIERKDQYVADANFAKPVGTGVDTWPATPAQYAWSLECAATDSLENWFADTSNRDMFAHVSHTFSHEILTNATYSDVMKEVTFNQAWLKQVGLSSAKRWSGQGLIPPAITGLFNGDAIKAFLDYGIINVVGDNTRPLLRNSQNSFWSLNTTVATNGYAGLNVIPRWATQIYYNCDLPNCTTQEWIDNLNGKGTFQDLLSQARDTAIRNLLGLHWDPYMFHQANMRVHDVATTTIAGKQGQFSLLMSWVETIVAEILRFTTWPIRSLKHDDIAQVFLNRQTRDLCRPSMTWRSSATGDTIESVSVYTAGGNTCRTPVPITVPIQVSSSTGATGEQLGSDPLTLWVTMTGEARQYQFTSAIQL